MSWYNQIGNDIDTVVSSRVRLARNLAGYPFPSKLSPEKAKEIIEKVSAAFSKKDLKKIDFSEISETMALSFVEKHYVSKDFVRSRLPHALLLSEKNGTAIMICEEDHLRIQSILPGLDLESAYKMASENDDILDSALEIAYDGDLGYLTHCPTNLGTGMRASVMMFLPALTMAGRINALASELSKLGLTMRGMYGEGSHTGGMLYQISNQITLGITEKDTLIKLEEVISQISEEERRLRNVLSKNENYELLRDKIMRSEGTLRYAHMLSSAELCEHFANIRLGIALGFITDISYASLGNLFIEAMPASLTLSFDEKLISDTERDIARAKFIKSLLNR